MAVSASHYSRKLLDTQKSPKRKRSRDDSDAESDQESSNEGSPESVSVMGLSPTEPSVDDEPNLSSRRSHSDGLSAQEKDFQALALDYEQRFCGHCNTTTDIKEANFFGRYTCM